MRRRIGRRDRGAIFLLLLAGGLLSGCTQSGATGGTLDKSLAQQFAVAVYEDPPAAPDFTLELLSGEMASLSDYRGRIVLLNFSTSW